MSSTSSSNHRNTHEESSQMRTTEAADDRTAPLDVFPAGLLDQTCLGKRKSFHPTILVGKIFIHFIVLRSERIDRWCSK